MPLYCVWHVTRNDSIGAVLDKTEATLSVWSVQIIKKDATNTPGDSSMFDAEVIVTPSLEFAVVLVVMLVANFLKGVVEVLDIIFIQIIGSQISATAKPPSLSIFLLRFNHLERSRLQLTAWKIASWSNTSKYR